MTTLGPNVRCVAATTHREAIARFYTEVFGATAVHPTPDLDVYAMDGGTHVGVYFVEPDRALTPAQQEAVGTWLEFAVDDVEATRAKIEAQGLSPLDYHDKAHHYFQAPGGHVFRLAAAAS